MLALSACLAQPAPAESTPTERLIPTATATPEATKRVTEEPVVPSPTPDCLLQGGTVSSEQIFSEALETDLDFDIYLPCPVTARIPPPAILWFTCCMVSPTGRINGSGWA